MKRVLRIVLCVMLVSNYHIPLHSSFGERLGVRLSAQHPVAPVTDWVATVDESTQQIVLRWRPSADSATMGYHICTGMPCLDYDTVFGRLDTTYYCLDHDPLQPHTYRLHVFDSNYNVSSLTPSFGNMVLSADVPECATAVSTSWTSYTGMPSGIGRYSLMVRQEPYEDDFTEYYHTDSSGAMAFEFDMPEGSTRVQLKVLAYSRTHGLVSQSNVVKVERLTVDSAAFVEIAEVTYDSLDANVHLSLHTDTAFHSGHYVLWRSIDGSPWREVSDINPTGPYTAYVDSSPQRTGKPHCYQLSVTDACDLNPMYSATRCVEVPEPPEPTMRVPSAIIAGDAERGTFLPFIQGWNGTLYELTIYSRTGLQLFATTDARQGWTPQPSVPQGAYAYVLHVGFLKGIVKTYAGTVVVIK